MTLLLPSHSIWSIDATDIVSKFTDHVHTKLIVTEIVPRLGP